MKIKNLVLSTVLATSFLVQSVLAVPIGTTADTRPAAPQQRQQWKNQGLNFQVGGNYFQGNINLFSLNTSLSYNLNVNKNQFFIDAGNIFTQSGEQVIANRINGTFLYAYNALDNLNFFYYMSHSHDDSLKLNYRLTNGAGVCLHKIASPIFDVFLVSLGISSENEWFEKTAPMLSIRPVLRVSATLPVADLVDIGVDSFYNPLITNIQNYRVYSEGFINFKVQKDFLNLKLSVADEYNSTPLNNVKNNDFGVFTTLSFNLGN